MTGSVRDDDDESVLDPSEQLNRPADTAFNQQRIQAWSPILDPTWVIIALVYLGVIMVPVGYKINSVQKDVVELKVTYDGYQMEDDPWVQMCGINTTYNANETCEVNFTAPRDMAPPILIHYEITNFHQNHRNYYDSKDPAQLRGEDAEQTVTAETACGGLNKLGNMTLNPCGYIANTFFNDIFTLLPTSGKDAYGQDLMMIEEGIAWKSDLEYKYNYAKGFRKEVCPEEFNCSDACCDGEAWSCTSPAVDRKDGKCYRYFYPDEDTTQYLYETYPDIISPLEHVRNEHFVVWMRIAAHDHFRKLYGWIDQPIRKGTVLRFQIRRNYVVTRFRGTKSLIVGTTSIFGGRNDYLAPIFTAIGYLLILVGLAFAFIQRFFPRRLADPAYLHYKED